MADLVVANCHMADFLYGRLSYGRFSSGKLSYGTLVRKQIVIWHFGLWQIAHGKLYDGELILAKYQNSHFYIGKKLIWKHPVLYHTEGKGA